MRATTRIAAADVIIFSVAASQTPHSPLNDLRESGAILREVIREVARQEPKLRWAIGDLEYGGTVLKSSLSEEGEKELKDALHGG